MSLRLLTSEEIINLLWIPRDTINRVAGTSGLADRKVRYVSRFQEDKIDA
jgi:hypothetical protein